MSLVGLPEAAAKLGVHPQAAKRALEAQGVPLVRINARAWAVDDADLQRAIAQRAEAGQVGRRGRPRKTLVAAAADPSGVAAP